MKKVRNSTKFTIFIGVLLVVTSIGVTIGGFITGAINSGNIVELEWCLLLSAAAFFGINLTRVATENVATINAATTASVNPPIEPTTVSTGESTATIGKSSASIDMNFSPFDTPSKQ